MKNGLEAEPRLKEATDFRPLNPFLCKSKRK